MPDLEFYYSAQYSEQVEGMNENEGEWHPAYHINAFDYDRHPILTSKDPGKIQRYSWGLIPHRTPSLQDALQIRQKTILCRSEEMYEKYSYQELIKAGKRCLIPTTGFFEHRWLDAKGKTKIPYYIFLKDRSIFSIAGIYSRWIDPATTKSYFTYSLLTTQANPLMEMIHNTGKRMPVILSSRDEEQAWLKSDLSKDDVLDLCKPLSDSLMDAYTVSRLVTSKDANVPQVLEPFAYPELNVKGLFGQ